jgi:hypothetical protein
VKQRWRIGSKTYQWLVSGENGGWQLAAKREESIEETRRKAGEIGKSQRNGAP